MSQGLAYIEYNNDVYEWRLFSPNRDKMAPLPPGWQSIHNDKDAEYVNMTLRSWGYVLAAADWEQDRAQWVVPVQWRERE